MRASVRALLSGIIDYAGLFPPAKLPLDEAVRNYCRYGTEPENWMLGRFVCPVSRLEELGPLLNEHCSAAQTVSISGVGRGGASAAEMLTGLRADLELISAFAQQHGRHAAVEACEVRLPAEASHLEPGALTPSATVEHILSETESSLEKANARNVAIFFELPLSREWRSVVNAVVKSLQKYAAHAGSTMGIKVRCGGLEPAGIPTPEQLAGVVACCRDHAVPLKLTAGLHHPLRHYDAGMQATPHGFLNMFGAGILAFADKLREREIQDIIEDENPADFAFDKEGFRWKKHYASTGAICAARRGLITSFGSCSFDEPRDDLRALGFFW
jgi:hypothetical protein